MSILFLADNHYGSLGGRNIHQALRDRFPFHFVEDSDYVDYLEAGDLERHSALVTCAIGSTCDIPHASDKAGLALRKWLETGVPVVLLHGGSASFWKWDWWRRMVGLRWVRGQDPDGVEASFHPVEPYSLQATSSSHPLAQRLRSFDVPEDEIYLKLEQTLPLEVLLETEYDGVRYPMAYATTSTWNNPVFGYLPGHHSQAVLHPSNLANIEAILTFALGAGEDRS